jgi:hypothetical protein
MSSLNNTISTNPFETDPYLRRIVELSKSQLCWADLLDQLTEEANQYRFQQMNSNIASVSVVTQAPPINKHLQNVLGTGKQKQVNIPPPPKKAKSSNTFSALADDEE